ncbi:MAG: hypothetical protein ACYS0E_10870 [Planctomycetota bacterium]|jgi:hypothetical protein
MRVIAKRIPRVAGGLMALILVGCQSGSSAQQTASIPAGASVTVYPITMVGQPRAEVGRVVAEMLERGGLEKVELAEQAFTPVADSNFEEQSQRFAAFAARQSLQTDYALYGVYFGTPKRGVDEVSSVLVDSKGRVVWSDRQKAGDKAFDSAKPDNPMSCTVLLVNRLRAPLHLDDPFRADAPKSKIAERSRREAGMPDSVERKAMAQRLETMRGASKPSVLVYPALVGDKFGDAQALTRLIQEQELVSARAAAGALEFRFQGSMNQQKVLWSAARSIQELVRKQKPDADYVIFAHYVMGPNATTAFGVHTFVLDRAGDFVVVDMQNSHHKDFQRIAPRTSAECAKLATVRLASYLK